MYNKIININFVNSARIANPRERGINTQGSEFYHSGTIYNGNIEYRFLGSDREYVEYNTPDDGFEGDIQELNHYSYYRRNHLGNVCEVWSPEYRIRKDYGGFNLYPAATVQRTQYYPSGLPWAEGTGASVQPYKEQGKEFVEMHWYDTSDFGARGLHHAKNRFDTPDPLCEKRPWESPYCAMGNNPVRYIDPDGRDLKYANGVSEKFKSQFATTVKYMNEKGTAGILKAINDHNGTIYLAEGKGDSYFDPSTNTIYWDTEMGVITTTGKDMSPATILNHEADHALKELADPAQKQIDKKTPDANYGNKEEKRVIEGTEQKTARKHGEIKKDEVTRTDHNGTPYTTKGPTTTEGKYEVTVIGKKKKDDDTQK